MLRWTQCWVSISMVVMSGCAICPPGYLDDYGAAGGKWQRSDPANGRVGSIFSDPGSVESPSAGYYGDHSDIYYGTGEDYSDEFVPGYEYSDEDQAPGTGGESQSILEDDTHGVIILDEAY